MNYYNEYDPKAAAWLRELINQGLIPAGDVDTRSIVDVRPADLTPYTQCHWFAGICGWPLALQLAGVPATTRLWTGSCPCQPFSTAGKGLAQQDERHLWPVFFDLIRQCRPECVFGEQVASAIGHGWLDGISADLDGEGYTCGAVVLGAHSVGSPHIRQRLYWVADSKHARLQGHGRLGEKPIQAGWKGKERHGAEGSTVGRMVLSNSDRCSAGSLAATPARHRDTTEPTGSGDIRMADSERRGCCQSRQLGKLPEILERGADEWMPIESASAWSESKLVHCRDGKTRRIPTKPAFFPLAHGIPARVVRLRGYGNAIVPQVAAEFIEAFYETQEPLHDDWI